MTGMDDLVTWLRAQWDEIGRGAQEEISLLCEFPYPDGFQLDYQWMRMARHPNRGVSTMFAPGVPTPPEVLADLDVKRRILEQYEIQRSNQGYNSSRFVELTRQTPTPYEELTRVKTHGWELAGRVAILEWTVRVLAAQLAGRDGYREEWKP